MTQIRPHLCGLLYCGEPGERHAKLRAGSRDPITTYALNAVTLANSARAAGEHFTVVTNDAARVERILEGKGLSNALTLREYDFALDVPESVPFHSAHYKLDLIRGFADGAFGPYPALVDLDAVLLRPLQLPDTDRFYAYDISEQMWGATPDRQAVESLERLTGAAATNPRWFGGEFLTGPADLFGELWQAIEPIWRIYRAQFAAFWHSGDEMVLSAALSLLAADDFPLADAGSDRLAARWWSRRTVNPIPPFDHARRSALLHLPADKEYLASWSDRPFDAPAFIAGLTAQTRAQLPRENLKLFAERLIGRPAQIAPRLT